MKNKIIVLVTGIILAALLAACQAPVVAPAAPQQPRLLSATGEGTVRLTPDIASISIGVHSQSSSVQTALNDNNDKAQAVAAALKGLGVDPKDIQTSAFNISPQQQTGPNGELTGEVLYMVDNTVNVTVRDLTKIGAMLDAVVKAGANNIYNIQFDVQNKDEGIAQARQIAIDNAKKQAADMAQSAGVELSRINNISVYSNPVPVQAFDNKGGLGGSAAPISAGQLVINIQASISYELK